MNRRYLLGLAPRLAAVGATLGLGAAKANAQEPGVAALECGGRYRTDGGEFRIVEGLGAIANGRTVIDLPHEARQAVLLPDEPLPDVSAMREDTRPASWFPEGQGILTRDGFAYRVAPPDAEDAHLVTAGGVKLYVAGPRVSVDAFGADPTGESDSTEAFRQALAYCAAGSVPGFSSGNYRITASLAPGGKYRWDWGVTRLDFTGAAWDDLTDVLANPPDSERPAPSGKRVLFDTRGCGEAVNSGSLTIVGSWPANMTLAGRQAIPRDVVAITASEGSSADMTWGTLVLLGCGHGLWQGDQRGAAPNILPYTRWQANYLKIQFCLRPLESGAHGNGFDDTFFNEVRLTRNGGASILRGTDIGGGVAFLNGLAPHADVEKEKAVTRAGSRRVTLSAANRLLRTGSIIVIRGAGVNKAGGEIDFAARVRARNGRTLELDRAPEATREGADILCDPPGITLSTTQWRFQQTYLEEIHDVPIALRSGSAIYGLVKLSNGDLSSRHDCGILLVDRSLARIALHATSANNRKLKAVVGVASLRDGAAYTAAAVEATVAERHGDATARSDIVSIVSLDAEDAPSGMVDATGDLNQNLQLTVGFLDGTRHFQRHRAGPARPAFTVGGAGALELGPPRVLQSAAFGGTMSDPASGAAAKAPGGAGYLQHPVSAGRRYRIAASFSGFRAGAPGISWLCGGTSLVTEVVLARSGGRAILFADAPKDAEAVRLVGEPGDTYTIDEFTVTEVLSV